MLSNLINRDCEFSSEKFEFLLNQHEYINYIILMAIGYLHFTYNVMVGDLHALE